MNVKVYCEGVRLVNVKVYCEGVRLVNVKVYCEGVRENRMGRGSGGENEPVQAQTPDSSVSEMDR